MLDSQRNAPSRVNIPKPPPLTSGFTQTAGSSHPLKIVNPSYWHAAGICDLSPPPHPPADPPAVRYTPNISIFVFRGRR